MTLGHLRITIRHFLGRGVQGVVVVGSTGRVAPRPRMPQVGQDRPAGRLGGYLPPETCSAGGLQAAPAILSGRLPRIWPPSLGTSCAQRPLRAISREAGVGARRQPLLGDRPGIGLGK